MISRHSFYNVPSTSQPFVGPEGLSSDLILLPSTFPTTVQNGRYKRSTGCSCAKETTRGIWNVLGFMRMYDEHFSSSLNIFNKQGWAFSGFILNSGFFFLFWSKNSWGFSSLSLVLTCTFNAVCSYLRIFSRKYYLSLNKVVIFTKYWSLFKNCTNPVSPFQSRLPSF